MCYRSHALSYSRYGPIGSRHYQDIGDRVPVFFEVDRAIAVQWMIIVYSSEGQSAHEKRLPRQAELVLQIAGHHGWIGTRGIEEPAAHDPARVLLFGVVSTYEVQRPVDCGV